jgi:hypothetical protein
MGIASAYPNTYRMDRLRDSIRLSPNLTGTSVAFDKHLENFTDPTDVGEIFKSPYELASDIVLLISRAETYPSYAIHFFTRERTSTVKQDYEMSLLEQAALLVDEDKFAEIENSIAWELRPVNDFLNAVKLALKCGAHVQARRLANAGGQRFPENDEMQKYARILAPSKIVDSHLPPDPDAAADMQWLKINEEEYRGRWVAMRSGVLLASASSRKELLVQIENPKDKSILITLVY